VSACTTNWVGEVNPKKVGVEKKKKNGIEHRNLLEKQKTLTGPAGEKKGGK